MNLIFVYGPPAVGKFTVSSELAHLTGYKLFHNHLTVDTIKPLFPNHDEHRGDLLKRLRLTIIEEAAKTGLNIIFTLAYSGRVDDEFVRQIVQAYNSQGGNVHFVQLTAPEQSLYERVGNESRRQLGKLDNQERLNYYLSTRTMHESVPYEPNLLIDTSLVTPKEAAHQIMQTYRLEYQH